MGGQPLKYRQEVETMFKLRDDTEEYQKLNSIRERVLMLPTSHPLRVRYRELRQALANASEDVAATGSTTTSMSDVRAAINRLAAEVEANLDIPRER